MIMQCLTCEGEMEIKRPYSDYCIGLIHTCPHCGKDHVIGYHEEQEINQGMEDEEYYYLVSKE